MKKTVLPVFLATLWISLSEFLRNEIIFKSYWTEHYESLQLKFPSEPINGAMWGVWSLCFAIGIFILSKKFNLLQTFATACFFWLCADVDCHRESFRFAIRSFTNGHSIEFIGNFSGHMDH